MKISIETHMAFDKIQHSVMILKNPGEARIRRDLLQHDKGYV
jgi:hypothetical protein